MEPVIHCGRQVKQSNKKRICRTLIQAGNCTKLAVSRRTGLSVATCGSILNELVEAGEVLECGMEKSRGGRPAKEYRYNENYRLALCLYLDTAEGKYLAGYYIVNVCGTVIDGKEQQSDHMDAEWVLHLIASVRSEYPAVCTVIVGLPGAVEQNSLVRQCSISALEGRELGRQIQETFQITTFLENDMNFRALGVYCEQGEQAVSSIAIVEFPRSSCAGAGFVVDGVVWKGSSNFAGEISYLPFSRPNCTIAEQTRTEQDIVTYITNVVLSITSILNPHMIVLCGSMIDRRRLGSVAECCRSVLPLEHIPKLVLHEDRMADYRSGLIWKAMQCWEVLDEQEITEAG